MPHLPRLVLAAAASLILGCGGFNTKPLPVSAADAPRLFAPLRACAAAQGLMVSEHPDSINVQVDGITWVQFMIQGSGFNMVTLLMSDVPDHTARILAARRRGEEIFACAMRAPPVPR